MDKHCLIWFRNSFRMKKKVQRGQRGQRPLMYQYKVNIRPYFSDRIILKSTEGLILSHEVNNDIIILIVYLVYINITIGVSYGNFRLIKNTITSFLGGLKGSLQVSIILDPKPNQRFHKIRKGNGQKIKLPVYTANDDISGEVKVELKDTKKYEHLGIKCMLIGYLCNFILTQKYFQIKIYLLNFIPSLNNQNLQEFSQKVRPLNSNILTLKRSIKHLMELLEELDISLGLSSIVT